MKHRINKQLLASLPEPISKIVANWKTENRKTFISVEESSSFYIDEDARYTAFSSDLTKQMTVRAAGEWAGMTALRPGSHCPLPVGNVVVATGFFCGMPWLTIFHNSGLKIEANTSTAIA